MLPSLLVCIVHIVKVLQEFQVNHLLGGNSILLNIYISISYRLVVTGSINSTGFITKFYSDSIGIHPDFSANPSTQFISITPNVYPITSLVGVIISSANTETVSNPSYNNQTVTYVMNSDVYYQISSLSLSIVENYSMQVVPDLTCSASGSTLILYSIATTNGGVIPSWITLDSNTGLLSISAPEVSGDAFYTFYINSVISGVTTIPQKLINLNVKDWSLNNWQKWSSTSISNCQICNQGYNLISGACEIQNNSTSSISSNKEASDTANSIKITCQTIISLSLLISLTSNMTSFSNMSSFWSMINQLQLFFLVLILGAFIPPDVIDVIKGMKIVLSIFNFIPFPNYELFDLRLKNPRLSPLDINSNSSIYNQIKSNVVMKRIKLIRGQPRSQGSSRAICENSTKRIWFWWWLWSVPSGFSAWCCSESVVMPLSPPEPLSCALLWS